MILANFKIEDMTRFRYAGQFHDLHNDYDFEGFKYFVSSQVLEMEWVKFDRKDGVSAFNKLPSLKFSVWLTS